jgi:hypothetical protein
MTGYPTIPGPGKQPRCYNYRVKGKTKRRLQHLTLYTLVGVFVFGTALIYLPFGNPAPTPTPVPINPGIDTQAQPVEEAPALPAGP